MLKRNMPQRILVLVLVSGIIACSGGCGILPGIGKSQGGGAELPPEIDPFQLRLGVERIIDKSTAAIVANAGDIAAKAEDRLVRENTVRWKIRANDAFQTALLESDARVAFIHGWTISVQLRKNLVDGGSKDDFGEFQESAIQVMRSVEADFVELGKQNFSAKAIEAASDDIEALGTGSLSVAALTGQLKSPKKGGSDLFDMLKIPLIPVTALGAVGDTPSAINRFTEATRGIGAVMQQLPEKTRWQLELLLLETGSTGAIARMLNLVEGLQQTVNQTVVAVQALPADIRVEVDKSLVALRETEPEMTAMLTQAQKTLEEMKSTIQEANLTVDETQKLLGNLEAPTAQIIQVAQAWQNSAKEVRGLLADWEGYTSKDDGKEEAADKEDAITIRDYTQMAAEMRQAAEQVRGLLADLDQPLSGKKSVSETVATVKGVINMVFWRAVLLLLLILIAAILYRFVTRALVPKSQR